MQWFGKGKRKEIWDEEIQWPIGDIEAAHRIRDICRSAADSAEKAGHTDDGKNKSDAARYERAARSAMEIAIRISDDLLRDSSVRLIVSLCMAANDLRTARILFRAVRSVSIREDLLGEYPTLRQ